MKWYNYQGSFLVKAVFGSTWSKYCADYLVWHGYFSLTVSLLINGGLCYIFA